MWAPTISSDELWHHGILGQSWGHRNGPPYPLDAGDHSAKEKKAGYKKSLNKGEIKSQKKRSKALYKAYKKDDEESAIKEISDSISEEEKKEIREKRKAWEKLFDADEGFYNSKEKREADSKAYDDVYKWYEENDPDELKRMIDGNNGDKTTLDQYHDFRKMYEGTQDEYWDEARKKYDARKGMDNIEKREEAAWDEYTALTRTLAKKVSGKYAKKKIKYGASDNVRVEEAVSIALGRLK